MLDPDHVENAMISQEFGPVLVGVNPALMQEGFERYRDANYRKMLSERVYKELLANRASSAVLRENQIQGLLESLR